jgi:hypothetical protein
MIKERITLVNNGKISTQIVSFGIPIIIAIVIYLQANPQIISNFAGPTYTGLVLVILAALVYNYQNPRNIPSEPVISPDFNKEPPSESELPDQPEDEA